jgi:uncharacterized protein (TIGR03000 family)
MLRSSLLGLALLVLVPNAAPAQWIGYGYGGRFYYGNGMYNIGGYPGYYYGGNPNYYGGWYGWYGPGYWNAPGYRYYGPDPAVSVRPSFYYDPATAAPQPVNQPVYVNVQVPADADVWFAGNKTEQTGPTRRFVSPPLPPGYNYTYDVVARWTRDGQPVEEKRTVQFTSGQQREVNVDLRR